MLSSAASKFSRFSTLVMTSLFLAAGVFCQTFANPAFAAAEKRVALVVGNSNYKEAIALINPRNDAQDMAATLKDVGFEVIEAIDADKRGMDMALANFNRAAKGASVALFYFAGHGMQYNGSNYILPTDAKLEDDVGLRYEAISLDQVRAAVDEASGVKIMILDACRNNPLASRLARSVAGTTRALPMTRGLARIEQTTGSVVAYATQANQVAEDGNGRNSPFTLALMEQIREPGVEIGALFRRVASSVYERTNGRQVPELSISLLSDFYLNERETDLQAWNKVRGSSDPDALRDFVKHYPSSMLADAARSRLDATERDARAATEKAARDEQERLAREAREKRIRDQIASLQRELDPAAALPSALAPPSPPFEAPGTVVAAAAPPPTIAPAPREVSPPQPIAALPPASQPPLSAAASTAPAAASVPPVIIAALPKPAEISAPQPPISDAELFTRFKSEMRRLGCFSASNDRDWNGAATKKAMPLVAKQIHIDNPPARLDLAALESLGSFKGRLCPSQCNARQAETGSGRCIAKTCGRGETLDRDGDCVDRAPIRRARNIEKAEPEKPSARRAKPAQSEARQRPRRILRERDIEDEPVLARRPRRVIEEPAVEARRPCTPGPSIGIGFGPIRLAAPLGGRC